MKIYVAGINGMVGSSIQRTGISRSHDIVGFSSASVDFLDRAKTFDSLVNTKSDALVIAAAKVGGIGANSKYPVEFLTSNLQIQSNLIDGAYAAGIKKVIFLGSSCIYPKLAAQPISEEALLTGPLESTNEPYAIAKIAGVKLIDAYRKEFGCDWISLMPTNLYGPNDSFDLENSHVLPALLRKIHEAKKTNQKSVTIWGDGSPLREFLFVDDLASAVIDLIESSPSDSLINVGSGEEVSIEKLALLIAKIVGFQGDFIFDSSKPNGTPRKLLDSKSMTKTGWKPAVNLSDGIRITYDWFLNNETAAIK
jgi:GDP-L-fucose synthase